MRNIVIYLILILLPLQTGIAYSIPPDEITSFEAVATQSISVDDVTAPYTITGESLVNIIHGMVDFDYVKGADIVFNRRTGQIFVKQTPSNHAIIEQIINQMRSASFQQVEIEARLVTVEATDFKGLGIDLGGFDYTAEHKGRQFGTEVPHDSSTVNTFSSFDSFVNSLNDTTYGGQFSFLALGSDFDLGSFIDALESRTEVNVLSSPKITVFNNQRAHLKIEKRQNFISEIDANFDSVEDATFASVFFQLETKVRQAQSGTILDVTPLVNSDGTIGLELHPMYVTADLTSNVESITNITGGDTFTNPIVLPIFVSQAIDTYLTIPNGGVAVLGGLITEEEAKEFNKVPFFGDIPWIGKLLFTQEKTEDKRAYLLIFIKAKVKNVKAR